jgi:hypothetical protein
MGGIVNRESKKEKQRAKSKAQRVTVSCEMSRGALSADYADYTEGKENAVGAGSQSQLAAYCAHTRFPEIARSAYTVNNQGTINLQGETLIA